MRELLIKFWYEHLEKRCKMLPDYTRETTHDWVRDAKFAIASHIGIDDFAKAMGEQKEIALTAYTIALLESL